MANVENNQKALISSYGVGSYIVPDEVVESARMSYRELYMYETVDNGMEPYDAHKKIMAYLNGNPYSNDWREGTEYAK